MGMSTIVNNGVATAFRLLDDLKKEVIFQKKSQGSTYNFTTRSVSTGVITDIATTAVVIEETNVNDQKVSRKKRTLLYPTKAVGDLALFETVKIDSEVWIIGKAPISETGHVSVVEVYKGVGNG